MPNSSGAQNSLYFNFFRGMDDSSGNNHLFYKEHIGNAEYYTNHVYHLDLSHQIDTILITEYSQWYLGDRIFNVITDFEFWHNNPAEYIYCGFSVWIDASAYIGRHDSSSVYADLGELQNIEISLQNDSLLYASGHTLGPTLLRSEDAGITWNPVLNPVDDFYFMISISPFNDRTLFSIYRMGADELYKSSDGGQAYRVVDSTYHWNAGTKMYFDSDSVHIYALVPSHPEISFLKSYDGGNSWQMVMNDTSKMSMCIDNSESGTVFLGRDRNLYMSTDYAGSFTLYRTLDRPVVGLYKKPVSDLLYVATEKDIFEISSTNITAIKSLPVVIEPGNQLVAEKFILYQNYPNPFNPTTTIIFDLPKTCHVMLKVYNILGEEVFTLISASLLTGSYQYEWDASNLASGVYLYRLQAGDYIETRKMVMMR